MNKKYIFETHKQAENALIHGLISGESELLAVPIFILGAPRTGSTVFYQFICSQLKLPYISNLTNEFFANTPIIGLAVQKSVPISIVFESSYGKTEGPFQPSEGSAVMKYWFGGGQPSAVASTRILDGLEPHLLATLAAAQILFGQPLVIKNAWNCFRIAYLAQTLPGARFLWIRRDVRSAAKSDLAARHLTKGSAAAWNSATPANIEQLRQLSAVGQVVENQHEFNVAIKNGLERNADGRWCEIWYEDFCLKPDGVLADLSTFLGVPAADGEPRVNINTNGAWDLTEKDKNAIDDYLAEHASRLSEDMYPAA